MTMLSTIASRRRRGQATGSLRSERLRAERRPMILEQLEARELLSLAAGPNINVSQRAGHQFEGAIAIDRTDPSHLFAASNTDTGSGIFAATSTNSGFNWAGRIMADGTDGLVTGCCDASAAFDDFGNLFVAYVSSTQNSVELVRSIDGGTTFVPVTTFAAFGAENPSVATGPGTTSPESVWVAWSDFQIRAAGGSVFGLDVVGGFATQTIQGAFFAGFTDVAVGAAGQVLVTYQNPADDEGPSVISTHVDPDGLGPQTFGSARQAAITSVGGLDFIEPQSTRAINAAPGLAYDRSGGLHDGRAYLVYTDEVPDESDDSDIFLIFSDNDGESWSPPIRVNDDTGTNSQFLPSIALDQTSGTVAIAWHDSRNDDGLGGPGDTDSNANTDTQLFGTASSDGGTTFEPNAQISTGTSNAGSTDNPFDYGDHTGVDFLGGNFYPIWADNSDNATGLGNNPTQPEFDVATSQVAFQDTQGPFVVSTDPPDVAVLNGPISFVDFIFNEELAVGSVSRIDVAAFTVTDTLGVTTDLLSEVVSANLVGLNVVRVSFNPQGPAGDYTLTIGPRIDDLAGNMMDQNMNGTGGQNPADRYTTTFSITTPVVTSVLVTANSIVVSFNKEIEPSPVTTGLSTCSASDNEFLERAGGDAAFAGDPGNTVPDVCVTTFANLTGPSELTLFFFGAIATDLYRVHLRSGGLTDLTPMDNPLDGEFDGPPPAGNNNTFPSGDGVVGGDFLYRFITGDEPLRAATAGELPPALVTGTPVTLPSGQNASAPSIAMDPIDPQRLVAAWTRFDLRPDPDFIGVGAAYSLNGGQTWNSIGLPGNLFNPATSNPVQVFPEATDASVAFDRNHSFYIVYSQHTGDYANGAIVLQKYDLSGGTPFQIVTNEPVYEWIVDAAFNPTVVVDTNLPSFTDPETGLTQTDIWSGNVYVAWNTQNTAQSNVTNANPNVIKVVASSNGGSTFTTQVPVNDGGFCGYNAFPPPFTVTSVNCGGERDGSPRMVVSQGTTDGRVAAGQLTLVWDEFSGSFTNPPPRQNTVVTDRITDGAVGAEFTGTGGFVDDGFDPGSSQPHISGISTFPITVNVSDPRFVDLTDLDVTINLQHSALNEVRLRLIPPSASGLGPIVLANNRTNAVGTANTNIGMSGANIGTTPSGFLLGGVFDQDAARSVVGIGGPYTGRFRPEGNLGVVNGLTADEINGTWTLEVTDFRDSNITQPPFPFLFDWSLTLTGGLTPGLDPATGLIRPDNRVAFVCALGTANGPHVSRPTVAPDRGVSPTASLASDNTLGSFSPFQGRLYLTYTTAVDPGPCDGSETDYDVRMLASDDAGVTWNALGFGGFFFGGGVDFSDEHQFDGSGGERSQLYPAVTVDPVTGTVVTAWLDARNDASNRRVATYVAASNDGGQTWSENVFINEQHTTVDNYDGSTRIYGPIPDNESSGNPARDTRFNFGDHIGLVAYDGVVHPIWPSNQNVTPLNNLCCTTDIVVGQVRVTDGPRIADSTMGWVDAPTDSFVVTFDRPVDPSTFTPDPGTPNVSVFQADFESGNDGFTFDNLGPDGTAGTPDDGLWHRSSGRGSNPGHSSSFSMYYGRGEGPAGGGNYNTGSRNSGTVLGPSIPLPASGPLVLSFDYFLQTEGLAPPFDVADVNVVVSSATTVASNTFNLLDPSNGFQPLSLDISSFAGQTIQIAFSFDTGDSIANNFEGWYVDDVSILQVGNSPDVQVIFRDVNGNDTVVPVLGVVPITCNVIGCSQFQVNFPSQSETGTYRYSVGPNIRDRIRLTSATITPGPTVTADAVPPQVPRPIPDLAVTTSTLDVTAAGPADVISDINVTLSLDHTFDSDLIISLVHQDGTRVILSDRNGGGGDDFTNTTFDDQAAVPIGFGAPPFTGSFQPDQALSLLNGKAVNGTYRLEIADVAGADIGTLFSWSVTIQTGSTATMGSIRLGNFMDQNANGLAAEQGPTSSPPLFNNATQNRHDVYLAPQSFDDPNSLPLMVTGPRVSPDPGAVRIGTEYEATDPALPLPLVDGGTAVSQFTIVDHFPITDLDVVIDISGANLADLRVELVREDNASTLVLDPVTVVLFDAGDASGMTMSRTVFSDEAAATLASGAEPYRGTFRPRGSLTGSFNVGGTWNTLDDFPGTPFSQSDAHGIWTLRVTDLTGSGGPAGTLNRWSLIVNPALRFSNLLLPAVIGDNSTTTSGITVNNSFTITDLNVHLNISHPQANDLDIVLRHAQTGTAVTLVADVPGGGSNFSNTAFDDEAPRSINDPTNVAPYTGFFRPAQALSLFDGTDAQGVWQLEITDDTGNNLAGTLVNWTLDFGSDVQVADHLALHGTTNFLDVVFDRDMDPSTFTTEDVKRIIGPAGQIGANPLGPFRYSTLDTTPVPVSIPDNGSVNSTIDVPDDFTIADVDVLVDITHLFAEELTLFLVGPDGTRVQLLDALPTTGTNPPGLMNTIFDDEATRSLSTGPAPYIGHFRPFQTLAAFDGDRSMGTWTLELFDNVANNVGTLNRWNLVLTRSPNQYSAATVPVAIPDTGVTVSSVITVQDSFAVPTAPDIPAPDSFSIHDLEVSLSITHARVEDLHVQLVAPDGTVVSLVASLPATGANLIGTTFDDEANNAITTGVAPYTGTFRPVIVPGSPITSLADFRGLDALGDWTLEITDVNAGNSGGATQELVSWSLAITPSDFRVLPNPNGTDLDASSPRTFRVYFPRQTLSGTYAISLGPNIESSDGEEIDINRNAGLAALRRGDGMPNSPETAADFQTEFQSLDVGDPAIGKPIPEPLGAAVRPMTSRIFVPDSVTIADLNLQLTITNQQPPGQPPRMRDDDYDVFLISPSGTRLELFTDVGGLGVDFVDLLLDDEAERCQKSCQPIYIQDGSAPFSDDFRPELLKPPSAGLPEGSQGLKVFDGENARGYWTLEIIDDTANGLTAALRNWSLEVSGRTTGLGEHASDQISTSFRLFVMDPADPRSSSSWTAVGPADIGGNGSSSRTGAIAVDPSDPSGNTVFVAGATSGVWKTTNFLTTDPQGPIWVPITDFAQTFGLHIGSIALFPRNNDPKQTIVHVATGEGDGGFAGVGFLKSEDGGATWQLQDSLNNDPNILFANRDHTLSRQTTSFKIVIDPTFPDGRVAYAAMSGQAGGIYKTVNGGLTWVNTRPGQATDVVIDPVNTENVYSAFRGEGVFISANRGAGWLLMAGGVNNVQVRDMDPSTPVTVPIGAPSDTPNGAAGRISLAKPFLTGDPVVDRAYEGRLYALVATPNDLLDGVYMTSDFGANWTELKLGIVPQTVTCPLAIPTNDDNVAQTADPFTSVGCSGQGNYDQAIIVDPQNPDRVYVLGAANTPALIIDVSMTYDGHNYTIFDYDNNDGGQTQLDTDGGALRKAKRDNGANPPFCEPFAGILTAGVSGPFCAAPGQVQDVGNLSHTGLYQAQLNNIASMANTGHETQWVPLFPPAHVDYHDVAAFVDPLTGKSRLLLGTDGGIFSMLAESDYDANGRAHMLDFATSPFGFTAQQLPAASIGNSIGPDNGSRNGNLQMSQFYGGATQPNQIAAEIADLFKGGGMFYGASQDNGGPVSDPLILDNGNLIWTGYGASGDSGAGLTAVLADDDSILGTVYIYEWSCCMGLGQEPFVIRRDGIPAVTGLDQENLDINGSGPANDIAINYRDGRELLYSAPTGRLYKTDDAGLQWLEIGAPAVFSNLQATAMAFGAEQPDPNPSDMIEPDEVLFVGLPNGRVFTSFSEGGDNNQEWFDISAGVSGGAVHDIAANIRQFHHDVYLVTTTRVFFMPEDPAFDPRLGRIASRLERAVEDVRAGGAAQNVNNAWVDITGQLRNTQHTAFPGAWNGEGPLGPVVDVLPFTFTSIKVDDRYAIPDPTFVPDPNLPPGDPLNQAPRLPLVYVGAGSPGGGSGAGVYRTFDNGQSWRRFPDPDIDGAPIEGGYLPNVGITEIELALGPYDPETGLSDFSTSLDLLVATTFGRGTWAIRSAPLIFASSGGLISNAPDLLDADDTTPPVPPFPSSPSIPYDQDNITSNDGSVTAPLRLVGLTHRGATVRLVEDVNGALTEIGRGLADPSTGDWTVFVGDTDGDGTPDGMTLDCGAHIIHAQAISASGTVGQVSDPIQITVLSEPPVELVAPDLLTADDTFGPGGDNMDDLTQVNTPRFSGATFCGVSGEPVPSAIIRLMVRDPSGTVVDPATGTTYRTVGLGTSANDGTWTVQVSSGNPLADGNYIVAVRAEDLAGNIGPFSPTLTVTIDTVVNPAPSITTIVDDTCATPPASCNFGSTNDRITRDQTLVISGIVEMNSQVTLSQSSGPAIPGGPVFPSVFADGSGNWTVDLTSITLADGTYSFTATAVDRAGNMSTTSAASSVTVDTTTPVPTTPDLIDTDDTCGPQTSVAPAACSRGSHTDNITRVTTPTLRGQAEVGSRVDIFTNVAGFTFLGSAIAGNDASDAALGGTASDGLGLWSFTVGGLGAATGPFNSGMNISVLYNVTAVATDLAGNVSATSNALALTIDTEPPAKPSSPPDLDSISDTFPPPPPTIGTDTDNITRDNTPTFNGANGSAEPDGLVTVTARNISTNVSQTLGTALANSLGGWTFTVATGSAALTGPLADGRYEITYDNTDIAGNISIPSDPLTPVVIDTVVAAPSTPDLADASDTCDPPSSVAPAPCDRGTHSDNITRTNTPIFTGTAEALGRVELFAGAQSLGIAAVVGNDASDGIPSDGKGAWSFTTNWSSLLPIDGTYTITARTTDQAGNTSSPSAGLAVTIDRSKPPAPTTPDLSPSSDTGLSTTDNITRGNGPAFNGVVTLTGFADVGTTVRIFDNATCTGPALGQVTPATNPNRLWTFITPSPLSNGVHSITASSTDAAGNESDCSPVLTLLIDTMIAQPSTPVLDPASDSGTSPNGSNSDRITFDNTPTLTGTVEANGTGVPQANTSVTVFDGGNPISSPFAANTSGAWSFTPITGLADGTHVITVQATDAAGNVSIFSAALNVTIDTVIAIPVISRITPDNGPSANDHVTNNGSLMFQGTAEPCTAVLVPSPLGCTQVTLTRVGTAGDFGVAFTDSLGNWTFDNSARVLAPGNYSFTATARDAAGNVSAATAGFNVTIDTAPPAIDASPSLELVDDTGLAGDLITKLRQPRLAGNVLDNLANVQVQIFRESDVLANNFSDPLGTATAAANGAYVVQVDPIHSLANGSYTVRIKATDAAGNAAISPSLTFTVDGTPPNVESFCTPTSLQGCPASPVTATTGRLVVTFNGTNLNACPSPGGASTECGTNPANAFAGSVLNPANYSLVGTTRGTFSLSTSQFVLNPGAVAGTSVLTINLRDASNSPTTLPNDPSWRFTIDATTSVQDIAGNKLDGEFPGTGTATCQPQSRPTGFPSGNCFEGGNFVRTFEVRVPPPSVVSAEATGTRKVFTHVVITFSGAMNRTLAEDRNNYELRDAGKDKRFGTVDNPGDDKIIQLALPKCNDLPADCTQVTLQAIRGFSKKKRPVRLTVFDTLQDVGGNRLDGNGDGMPGGNFTKSFGPPALAARTEQVAAQVVDRMLETGYTPSDLLVDDLLSAGAPRGRRYR